MIPLIILYGIVVLAISLWYRHHSTGDEYLMGDRRASSFLVGAALFTLVGGGELVTLTSLAYTFGYAALALFLGYAIGFCFLGLLAGKIRLDLPERLHLSLPDYIHVNFGPTAGHTVFLISFGAFFSMLLIQFTAGGQVLSALTALSYEQSVLLTAGIATVYLFIGGFKTVLATDVVQGAARLLLMPLIVIVAARGLSASMVHKPIEALPIKIWISLVVTGCFSSASSADVWQRIYAARSEKAARNGLFGGAALLMLFGYALVALGLVARTASTVTSADSAFTQALSTMLPHWAVIAAVVLVLSTIMSTADTEMFLLSGMAVRELIRLKGENNPLRITAKESVIETRWFMIVITTTAVGLSLVFRELVPIYTWLLSAILVMAPTILASLLFRGYPIAATVSLTLNTALFAVLAVSGLLSPETAYYIVLPGLLVYAVTYFAARPRVSA